MSFLLSVKLPKVPGLSKDVELKAINAVGIIGAGTMGGGIAMNFANVGIPVTLLEMNQEALEKGLRIIRRNYEASANKGALPMRRLRRVWLYSPVAPSIVI
jgi:3-hydroxyacyl-CoA dehydrogenase